MQVSETTVHICMGFFLPTSYCWQHSLCVCNAPLPTITVPTANTDRQEVNIQEEINSAFKILPRQETQAINHKQQRSSPYCGDGFAWRKPGIRLPKVPHQLRERRGGFIYLLNSQWANEHNLLRRRTHTEPNVFVLQWTDSISCFSLPCLTWSACLTWFSSSQE